MATKKEKVVFIPTWFIVTDPANSDISTTLTLLNVAHMYLQSMKTELNGFASLVALGQTEN